MNNSDPNKIILAGDQLAFWRSHADFLNSLADFPSDEPGKLIIERKDGTFPSDVHFDFFWDIVHGKPIAHTKDKNGKLVLKKEKGYTRDQIITFAHYIGYDLYNAKSKEDLLRRFKADVLDKLPLEVGANTAALGHGKNKPRAAKNWRSALTKTQRKRAYIFGNRPGNYTRNRNTEANRWNGGKRTTRRNSRSN